MQGTERRILQLSTDLDLAKKEAIAAKKEAAEAHETKTRLQIEHDALRKDHAALLAAREGSPPLAPSSKMEIEELNAQLATLQAAKNQLQDQLAVISATGGLKAPMAVVPAMPVEAIEVERGEKLNTLRFAEARPRQYLARSRALPLPNPGLYLMPGCFLIQAVCVGGSRPGRFPRRCAVDGAPILGGNLLC